MKLISMLCAAGVSLITPSSAQGQTPAYCQGTVANVYIEANGDLSMYAGWRGDFIYICNINTGRGAINATTCTMWSAILLNAQLNNKPVLIFYPTLTQDQCSTMPTYGNAPAPGYVMARY